jgi:hypothetical protein
VPALRHWADDSATVDFHVRMTPGEAEALAVVIARWVEDLRTQGLLVGSDGTSWFRVVVRREALARGIAIADPSPLLAEAVEGKDAASPR